MSILSRGLFVVVLSMMGFGEVSAEAPKDRQHSPGVKEVPHAPGVFKADPQYGDQVYDAKQQWLIYGGKKKVESQRPLLELGRDFLTGGPYESGLPMHFIVYGDARVPTAAIFAEGASAVVTSPIVNLEVDWKITSSSRIHALLQPFQSNLGGKPTFSQFGTGAPEGESFEFVHMFQRCVDEECDALKAVDEFGTLYWESDLGTNLSIDMDLPYAIGKLPLIFQNGIWVEDAFLGGAFTFPAMNSPALDISNFDITFFAGLDGVTTRAAKILDDDGTPTLDDDGTPIEDHNLRVFGTNLFLELGQGYVEVGYGFVQDADADNERDLTYQSATFAFTRRYFGRLSNSVRVVGNFGQQSGDTANGVAILIENSFVTSKPSTFIPYFNFFVGIDRPQPLARAAGLLRNTGILYEVDPVNLLPAFSDDAHDVVGGAIGVENLFSLDQQLVFEVAAAFGLCSAEDDAGGCARKGARDEAGLAIRHQLPLGKALLLRTDGVLGSQDPLDDGQLFAGARVELRFKF